MGITTDRDTNTLVFDPPSPGCVLFLPGLPGAGSKTQDRSPHGHSCAITGAVWKHSVGGGWYLDFDGIDDFVNVPNSNPLNVNHVTLLAWICGTSSSSMGNAISKVTSDTKGYAMGRLANGDMLFRISTLGGTRYQGDASVLPRNPLNTWSLFGLTYNGVTIRLFGDGQQKDNIALSGNIDNNTLDLKIGRRADLDITYMTGGIALALVANRAWTLGEVSRFFNETKHLFGRV